MSANPPGVNARGKHRLTRFIASLSNLLENAPKVNGDFSSTIQNYSGFFWHSESLWKRCFPLILPSQGII
jgi:hypothetical protein